MRGSPAQLGLSFCRDAALRQLCHGFGCDLREGELHRADAGLRPLAGGQESRDLGEAAPAALDFIGRGPVGEAQCLRHFRCRARAIEPPAGGIGDGLDQPERTERHAVVVAGEPGLAARHQAIGAGKRDGHRPPVDV